MGREGDPYLADRVVGARREIQRFLHIDAAQIECLIVVIGRIFGNARNFELARWRGPLRAADSMAPRRPPAPAGAEVRRDGLVTNHTVVTFLNRAGRRIVQRPPLR